MITFLNKAILTSFDAIYTYKKISLDEMLVHVSSLKEYSIPYQSAVGHQVTADILSELLGIDVPMNRIEYKQKPEDVCYVFKLRGRAEEGKILNREEIEKIGYDFGILIMKPLETS